MNNPLLGYGQIPPAPVLSDAVWNPLIARTQANTPWTSPWDVEKEKNNKYDAGKPPIDLVDPEFIEGTAGVLGFGANKYKAHQWRDGIRYSRLIAAAHRHLNAINKGEDIDVESELPHVYHLSC